MVLTIRNTTLTSICLNQLALAKLQSILDNVNQVAWERISLLARLLWLRQLFTWQNQHRFPGDFGNQLSAAAALWFF